jgi:putative membrane protein
MKETLPNKRLIIALSVAIPVAVAVLFKVRVDGYDLRFLPGIYASINALTSLLLVAAWVSIRAGKRILHERLMKTCLGLSALFLILYVLYHMTSDPTSYGGEGLLRGVYFVLLISHIVLSVGVIPLVLFTFSYAIAGNFDRHRRLAKFTFPVWLYVTVTGVIVYLMISPYYV